MARAYTGKIFNRPDNDNSYAAKQAAIEELRAWAGCADPIRLANGANIEHDWRVSAAREAALWELPSEPLEKRLRIYYKSEVVKNQSFTSSENDCNRCSIPTERELITFVKISDYFADSVRDVWNSLYAKDRLDVKAPNEEIWTRVQTLFPNPRPVGPVLSKEQQAFLEHFFARIESKKQHQPPIWVAIKEQLQNTLHAIPDEWLSAVGVKPPVYQPFGKPPLPAIRLCLAISYPVGERSMYRPTFLDSGLYEEHFPSPPISECAGINGYCVAGSGHPMSLRKIRPTEQPLDEYIHADNEKHVRTPAMVIAWGWTSGTDHRQSLVHSRYNHYNRLQQHYDGIEKWMPEPI